MHRLFGLTLSLVLLLAGACGSGGSNTVDDQRILHLRTGDYTEAALRARIRSRGLTEVACRTIKGLPPAEVLGIINANFEDDSSDVIQEANPADDLRQAEIVLEECERIY